MTWSINKTCVRRWGKLFELCSVGTCPYDSSPSLTIVWILRMALNYIAHTDTLCESFLRMFVFLTASAQAYGLSFFLQDWSWLLSGCLQNCLTFIHRTGPNLCCYFDGSSSVLLWLACTVKNIWLEESTKKQWFLKSIKRSLKT